MFSLLLALSLSLSLLLSPESQVILGNSVGLGGWLLWPVLPVVAGVAYLTIQRYGKESEFSSLHAQYGLWLPLCSLMASRLLFFITASTIVLATAGYVFNEVFVSSFPNFGFAFLLLGFVLVVQCIGGRVSGVVQMALVFVWLCGLLYLVVSGLGAESHPKAVGVTVFSYRGVFLPFLLLVGVELGLVGGTHHFTSPARSIWFGVAFFFLLLATWGFIMGNMVDPQTLSTSFIPHTKSARRLLGDPGRVALGMAMIAGTVVLVNGLLTILVAQLKEVGATLGMSASLLQSTWFRIVLILLVGTSPGWMMAHGMAGHEVTEVYLRASLLFWLLHFGQVLLMGLRQMATMARLVAGFVVVLLLVVVVGLVYFDLGRNSLLASMGWTFAVSSGLAGIGVVVQHFTVKKK